MSRGALAQAESSLQTSQLHARALGRGSLMLASSLEDFAHLRLKQKQISKALALLKLSLAEYKLESTGKNKARAVRALAKERAAHVQGEIAVLHLLLSDYDSSEKSFRSALREYATLLRDFPEDKMISADFADTLTKFAKLKELEGKENEAARLKAEAAQLCDQSAFSWYAIRARALAAEKTGNMAAAKEGYEEALAISEKKRIRDFSYFQSLIDLKRICQLSGDYKALAKYASFELKEYQSILLGTDPKLIELKLNYASYLAKAKDKESLHLLISDLGASFSNDAKLSTPQWQNSIKGLANLGEELSRLLMTAEADECLQLADKMQVLHCPKSADSRWAVSKLRVLCLAKKGKTKEAVDELEKAFTGFGAGGETPGSGAISADLLAIINELNFADNGQCLRAAQVIAEKGKGKIHPYNLMLRVYGQRLLLAGQYAKAEPVLSQALALALASSQREDAEIGYCLLDQANLQRHLNKSTEALASLQKASKYFIKSKHDIGLDIIAQQENEIRFTLAGSNQEMKDLIEPYYLKRISATETQFGEGSRQTVPAVCSYASYLTACGKFKKAGAAFRKCLSILKSNQVGIGDPQLRQILAGYADLLAADGKAAEAQKIRARLESNSNGDW